MNRNPQLITAMALAAALGASLAPRASAHLEEGAAGKA